MSYFVSKNERGEKVTKIIILFIKSFMHNFQMRDEQIKPIPIVSHRIYSVTIKYKYI